MSMHFLTVYLHFLEYFNFKPNLFGQTMIAIGKLFIRSSGKPLGYYVILLNSSILHDHNAVFNKLFDIILIFLAFGFKANTSRIFIARTSL